MNTTANITELRTQYMRVFITPYEMYEYGYYVRATRGRGTALGAVDNYDGDYENNWRNQGQESPQLTFNH